MAYFPLIQKDGGALSATHHRRLPRFYMADFSVVGLKVNDCDRAIRILDQHQFPLKRIQAGVEVGIDGPAHLLEVV